jgi:hypothetical protein
MDDKNPYVGLLEIMGKEAAALQPSASGGCMTGTVKSVDPLTITCNGLDVDGDALFVNATLRHGYERKVTLDVPAHPVNATISATAQTIKGVKAKCEEWALKKGDLVLVLPSADMQTYHVICKLEAANA